ncbi:unnamed protein product [Acanthoscelides obtectus]|uniref:Uncharacterized protein n=2 Tax=Acanthoscelides obtectus TaxID=200917 RepID=A0A9P0KCP5_ACAOB|nr:unnamed protein product [Acanthoscelides obtectus]CAK1645463.1 hypothetical protein AOBTE_LOCUS14120 [Acanthoscelides obtectus]
MKGIVNRKSKDHLGLLLYNALNVSILKPKDNEEWIGEFVDIGCEVLFKITYFSLTSFMPYIRGEVISVLTDVSTITKTNIDDTEKKQKPKKRKQVEPIEEVSKSKRKKVDNSSTDEPEHGSIKKYSKSLISDIDQTPSDVANNNSSKQKSKGHEDSSIQNSTGYTTFEENLLENADIVEETEEKKSKKYKQIKRRSSETTVVPSIAQRNSMFSSVDSPLMKIVGDDSTTLNADSEDLTSTFKIETLKEKNKTKVKKDKRKSIALLEKDISDEAYLEDTQLKVTVKEEKPSTKKNKSKKHDKSIESTTFNIPIMIKEEPTLDDIPVKKKSKKHKDKSHEDEA